MTIIESDKNSVGDRVVAIRVVSGLTTISHDRLPHGMPLSIPADELYFWTEDWQEGERRADEEFAAGEGKEFDNFMDLARDLLSPE